ncbi:MAG: hypothetical protein H6843_07765 [Rhodospirillaceae bacterium]|nr:hypothetical protein [Rhodospirillaceae bacterium]
MEDRTQVAQADTNQDSDQPQLQPEVENTAPAPAGSDAPAEAGADAAAATADQVEETGSDSGGETAEDTGEAPAGEEQQQAEEARQPNDDTPAPSGDAVTIAAPEGGETIVVPVAAGESYNIDLPPELLEERDEDAAPLILRVDGDDLLFDLGDQGIIRLEGAAQAALSGDPAQVIVGGTTEIPIGAIIAGVQADAFESIDLAALLLEGELREPAAAAPGAPGGQPGAEGGSAFFAPVDPVPLGDGFNISPLLGPTGLQFGVPEPEIRELSRPNPEFNFELEISLTPVSPTDDPTGVPPVNFPSDPGDRGGVPIIRGGALFIFEDSLVSNPGNAISISASATGGNQLTQIVINGLPNGSNPDPDYGEWTYNFFGSDALETNGAVATWTENADGTFTLTITFPEGVTDYEGMFRLAPAPDEDYDPGTVTAVVTDNFGNTSTANIYIAVDALADQPEVNIEVFDGSDANSVFSPGEEGTGSVSASFSDVEDGSEQHFLIVEAAENFLITGTGTYTATLVDGSTVTGDVADLLVSSIDVDVPAGVSLPTPDGDYVILQVPTGASGFTAIEFDFTTANDGDVTIKPVFTVQGLSLETLTPETFPDDREISDELNYASATDVSTVAFGTLYLPPDDPNTGEPPPDGPPVLIDPNTSIQSGSAIEDVPTDIYLRAFSLAPDEPEVLTEVTVTGLPAPSTGWTFDVSAISGITGVTSVDYDATAGTLTVTFDPAAELKDFSAPITITTLPVNSDVDITGLAVTVTMAPPDDPTATSTAENADLVIPVDAVVDGSEVSAADPTLTGTAGGVAVDLGLSIELGNDSTVGGDPVNPGADGDGDGAGDAFESQGGPADTDSEVVTQVLVDLSGLDTADLQSLVLAAPTIAGITVSGPSTNADGSIRYTFDIDESTPLADVQALVSGLTLQAPAGVSGTVDIGITTTTVDLGTGDLETNLLNNVDIDSYTPTSVVFVDSTPDQTLVPEPDIPETVTNIPPGGTPTTPLFEVPDGGSVTTITLKIFDVDKRDGVTDPDEDTATANTTPGDDFGLIETLTLDPTSPAQVPTSLTSGGDQIFINTTTDGNGGLIVTGSTSTTAIFTLTITVDGGYSFQLTGPLDHPETGPVETPSGELGNIGLNDVFTFGITVETQSDDGVPLPTFEDILDIVITDDGPQAIVDGSGNPAQTIGGTVQEDALDAGDATDDDLVTGNPEGTGQTDEASGSGTGANGSLSILVDAGVDVEPTFGLVQTGLDGLLPALQSGGTTVDYQVTVAAGSQTLTATVGTDVIFTLTVNNDGSWTFDLDGQLDHTVAGDDSTALATEGGGSVPNIDFSAIITVTDYDGDVAVLSDLYEGQSGLFTITVENDIPAGIVDAGGSPVQTITGAVQEDALNASDATDDDDVTGNPEGTGQTDEVSGSGSGANGSLSILVSSGADEPATYGYVTTESSELASLLPTLYSAGELLTYTVSGETLTATRPSDGQVIFTLTVESATGNWSFDLDGQLDHVVDPTNPDDTTLLQASADGSIAVSSIDFSAIVTVSDADVDTLTLSDLYNGQTGLFTITVENDIPAGVVDANGNPMQTISGAVQEDALGNEVDDPAANDIDDVTGNPDNPGVDTDMASGSGTGANGSLALLVSTGADEPATFGFIAGGAAELAAALPTLYSAGELLTYAVSGETLTATRPSDGQVIFTLTVDETNGNWSFDLDGQLDHVVDPANPDDTTTLRTSPDGSTGVNAIDFSGVITATDADGDTLTLSDLYNGQGDLFTIAVENDIPAGVVNANGNPVTTVSGAVQEDALGNESDDPAADDTDLVTGNLDDAGVDTDSASGTDGGAGDLSVLVSTGADEPATFALISATSTELQDAMPALFSGGTRLFYAISGNTLTAYAGQGGDVIFTLSVDESGAWSFNLDGQLDHVAGSGDDGTELQSLDAGGNATGVDYIDFSAVVTATDADGDTLTLSDLYGGQSGLFTVDVENDIPAGIVDASGNPVQTVQGSVQEDALGNEANDPAADDTDLVTGLEDDAGVDTDTASGTDGGAGDLSVLVSTGADEPTTFGLISATSAELQDAMPALFSAGTQLFYEISGSTLTAYAGQGGDQVFTLTVNADGSWTFNLDGELDHVAVAGEDGTELQTLDAGGNAAGVDYIDFSAVVTATDFDGDTLTLSELYDGAAGVFSVEVENDAPIAVDDDQQVVAGQTTTVANVVDNDSMSADGSVGTADNPGEPVVQIASGNLASTPQDVTTAGPTTIAGEFGSLTIYANGDYTYTANANAPISAVDNFVYTIEDFDGDQSSATLSIAIESVPNPDEALVPEPDIPETVTTPPGGDPLFEVPNDATLTSITLDIFDIDKRATGTDTDTATGNAEGLVSTITLTPGDAPQDTGLTSGGETVLATVASDGSNGLTVTGTANGVTVFTLTMAQDGTYEFTLSQPLDHPETGPVETPSGDLGNIGINDVFTFGVTVEIEDGNGDPLATLDEILDIVVTDDGPAAFVDAGGSPLRTVSGAVQEDALNAGDATDDDAVTGNPEGTGQTDEASGSGTGANGSLSILVDSGVDVEPTFGFITGGSAALAAALPALTSGGTALTYTASGDTLTATANGQTIFTLTINSDGSWSFDLDGQLDHTTAGDDTTALALDGGGSVSSIDFSAVVTVTDFDGDTSVLSDLYNGQDGLFTITVENDIPAGVVDAGGSPVQTITGTVQEDALGNEASDPAANDTDDVTGNLDNPGVDTDMASGSGTGANGSLALLVSTGADEPATFGFVTTSSSELATLLPTLYSAGELLTYAVSGDTLTATRPSDGQVIFTLTVNETTGNWSFDLDGQLDHVVDPTNPDDATLLRTSPDGTTSVDSIDFSAVITVSDADVDTLTLSDLYGGQGGLFTIAVENDIPAGIVDVGGNPVQTISGTVQEDALGNEGSDPAANDTDDVTGNLDNPGVDTDMASGSGTGANGSLSGLVSTGADEPATFGFIAGGAAALAAALPTLYSAGELLTYAVSGDTLTATRPGDGQVIFTLTVNETTGNWSFDLDGQLDHVVTTTNPDDTTMLSTSANGSTGVNSIDFSAVITVTDADGDELTLSDLYSGQGGLFTIAVENDIPAGIVDVGGNPVQTISGTVQEDALGNEGSDPAANDTDDVTGNLDNPGVDTDMASGSGTGANGSLSGLVSTGADEPATFGFIAGGAAALAAALPSLYSAGELLTYAVSGDTLTATRPGDGQVIFTLTVNETTGNWSFDLDGQLDHVVTTTNPDDTTTLSTSANGSTGVNSIDFSAVITVTDADGDELTLSDLYSGQGGLFTIAVENDIPAGIVDVGGNPVQTISGTVQEDALGNEASDPAANDTDDVTGNLDNPGVDTDMASGSGTGANGSLSGLVSTGADEPATFGFIAGGAAALAAALPTLYSAGELLTYAVSGDTLTATRPSDGQVIFTLTVNETTGNWSFDLDGQLDHVVTTTNPDDTTTLSTSANGSTGVNSIDFSAVITVTDADGDELTLSDLYSGQGGLFTIAVENDIPVVDAVSASGTSVVPDSLLLDETIASELATGEVDVYGPGDTGVDNAPANVDEPASDGIGQSRTTTGTVRSWFTGSTVSIGADQSGNATVVFSLALALALGGTEVTSLVTNLSVSDDSYTDASITLFNNNGVIEGRVGGSANDIAFTIELDGTTQASGLNGLDSAQVVVTQYMALEHDETGGTYDESLILSVVGQNATLGVRLDVTATDADGDQVTDSASAVLANASGGAISFDDDGPRAAVDANGNITTNTAGGMVYEDALPGGNLSSLVDADVTVISGTATSGSGLVSLSALVNFGEDGPGDGGGFAFVDTAQVVSVMEAQGLTSGGTDLTYSVSSGANSQTLTASAGANTIFTLEVEDDGDWTFTLSGPVDHATGSGDASTNLGSAANPMESIDFSAIVSVTDADGDTSTLADLFQGAADSPFAIQIQNDVPIAQDDVVVASRQSLDYNVTVMLDLSGSMGEDPDGNGPYDTRLELALDALTTLITTMRNESDSDSVTVSLLTFHSPGGTPTTDLVFEGLNANEALAALQAAQSSFVPNGQTPYETAINALTQFLNDLYPGQTYSVPDATGNNSLVNLVYWLSDGRPVPGDSGFNDGQDIDPSQIPAWESALQNKGFEGSYAVGIGSDITGDPDAVSELNKIAYPNDNTTPGGPDDYTLLVTDESQLAQVLVDTIPIAAAGDVFDTTTANDNIGADGGFYDGGTELVVTQIESINPGGAGEIGNLITDADGSVTIEGQYGTLTIGRDGQFRYDFDDTNGSPDDFQFVDVFRYTITDADGDSVDRTLAIRVGEGNPYADGSPIVGDTDANNLDDVLIGGGDDDLIIGGQGADQLFGNGNNDILIGGEGDDILSGGAGEDILRGGRGEDTLTGGDDADRFVLAGDDTGVADLITDFDATEDTLDLSQFFNSGSDAQSGTTLLTDPGNSNLVTGVEIGGHTVASFTTPVDISGTGGIQVVVDDTGTPVTITA